MPVQQVSLGGKEYPINFGTWAMHNFCEENNLGLNDLSILGGKLNYKIALSLVFHGLKDGARLSKEDFNMELMDVADLVDQEENGLEKVFNLFTNSLADQNKPKKGNQKGVAK